jgi:hypothetical protein
MAALKPDVPPGWDDGPSRPGLRTRRTVIFVISGLLLVCTPIFLLMLWGMAHPSFGPGTVKPVTSTLTISLSIRQSEWSRLVQAADSFAIQHGLVDSQAANIQPSSELGLSRVRYEGSGADLEIGKTSETDVAALKIHIRIREFSGSGDGQHLKTAFENDVINAGRFGE